METTRYPAARAGSVDPPEVVDAVVEVLALARVKSPTT
jgi:hypothetical protein